MIRAIHGKGQHRVEAICDGCGFNDVLACDYIRDSGGDWRPNKGQAHKKLTDSGWSVRKGGRLHCPACAARKRAVSHQENQGEVMTVKHDEPDVKARELPKGLDWRMAAMIVDMLNLAYDKPAGRYKNPADTDRTIAEAIGEGCLWGWVAMIRAQDYGPEGDGAEIAAIRAEIDAAKKSASEAVDRAAKLALMEIDVAKSDLIKAYNELIERAEKEIVKSELGIKDAAGSAARIFGARLKDLDKRINALVAARGGTRGKARA